MENANKKTATAFVVVSGEYSDYGIHSVWTDRDEAQSICDLGNRSNGWSDYRVEEYPLDAVRREEMVGWQGKYDYAKHGYPVDVKNIEMVETLVSITRYSPTYMTWEGIIQGGGLTREAVTKSIFDVASQEEAKKQGLTT